MSEYNPPPPYAPTSASATKHAASFSTIPLHLVHRIISLTLDPRATPSRFSGDDEEERVRRLWALFRGIRGVDRRFYLGESSRFLLPRLSTNKQYPHQFFDRISWTLISRISLTVFHPILSPTNPIRHTLPMQTQHHRHPPQS
jgi:hypothetical protein